MYKQLPIYQNQGARAYKPKLQRMYDFMDYLGNPEKKIKFLHIAGTNGKGSTAHLLASVLQETQLKIGLYTSPHLKDFRERIKVNGKYIEKKNIVDFVHSHFDYLKENNLSFFEMNVGLAFSYFILKKIDIAIIEVGMGGRLDATNVITPILSIITNIGFDHTQFLGNSYEKIATEKAGIIKKNGVIIIGETQRATTNVFKKIAEQKKASLIWADQQENFSFTTDLKGIYQKKNIQTAYIALKKLKEINISKNVLIKGFKNVVQNTNFKGRWQTISENPKIIGDVSHNREGFEYVFLQLKEENYTNLHMVMGFVKDKNLDTIFNLFPQNAAYYFCQPKIERALAVEKIKPYAKKYNLFAHYFSNVKDAYQKAKAQSKPDDLIYVGGSTFVLAEIL